MKKWIFKWIEVKIAVFWDVVPYNLVEFDRGFRGDYCFHHQGDGGSKPFWNVRQIVLDCNIPEDSHLHTLRHETLKSHLDWSGSGAGFCDDNEKHLGYIAA
jgi:hypothetical protein